MIRTQIYLTKNQHIQLRKKAASQKSSLSHQIRLIIEKDLEKETNKSRPNTGEWLLSMAEEAEKLGFSGPKDLSSNIDKYLYGRED